MNNWNIAGRIGKDAVVRHTTGGKSVTGFSVALDRRVNGEKVVDWVDCSIWEERGERLAPYLLKGTAVALSGEAGVRVHEGKGYQTLRVQQVTLLGSKSDGEKQQPARGGGGTSRPARQPAPTDQPPVDDFSDDDIPFVTNRGTF